jgi:hypothetical protein
MRKIESICTKAFRTPMGTFTMGTNGRYNQVSARLVPEVEYRKLLKVAKAAVAYLDGWVPNHPMLDSTARDLWKAVEAITGKPETKHE